MCEGLTDFHHLRSKFNIRTSDIKYLFQRFIEPDAQSYHANRFDFIYELHRARGINTTDQRDRVFAFLGHYALRSNQSTNHNGVGLKANYTKTVEQVYIDVAKWALSGGQGDSSLIALAAVQHISLPSLNAAKKQNETGKQQSAEVTLPSWVPDWRTYQGFILSEPINPHRAHGRTKPKLEIGHDLTLSVRGLEVDIVETCSRLLVHQEFHSRRKEGDAELPIQYLWHKLCLKSTFNLQDRYINGQQAFFALMQTLSNGCVQIAGRESRPYNEIPDTTWIEQAALYLKKALGSAEDVDPALLDIAQRAEQE